ncbi:MAG: hypothetical protein HRT47_07505 [Candidatus Caenarcaniphilales bacterium]|nr:hypothetical protein [Candidatus Caenarcaniphilales bacterium]
MQISENTNLQLDQLNGVNKDAAKDSKADSTAISDSSDNIDNLFGLFEDDGDYSEIVGDILDDKSIERSQTAVANENLAELEEIFEETALVDDPEMQEFFNQQIIDASSSLAARQEYMKQNNPEADSSDAVEASLF